MTEKEIKNRISELEKELGELRETLRLTSGRKNTFSEELKYFIDWRDNFCNRSFYKKMDFDKRMVMDWELCTIKTKTWVNIRMEATVIATKGRTSKTTEMKGDEILLAKRIAKQKIDDYIQKIEAECLKN